MFLNFCAYYALTLAHFRHIFLAFLVRFIFLEFYFSGLSKPTLFVDILSNHSVKQIAKFRR